MPYQDSLQHKQFSRRAVLIGSGQLALLGLLGGRLYHLQVVERERYQLLAEENRINLRLLAPPRGRVLDRFGAELATNRRNYRLLLVAEEAGDPAEVIEKVARLVRLEEWQKERVLREVRRRRQFVPVEVASNLTWDDFARINVNVPDLPGIHMEVGQTRDYPMGPIFAHVVGYVGAVSESEIGGDPVLELPGFRIGKTGVERVHDVALRGRAGDSQVEVNAFGRVIRELSRTEGRRGDDMMLTLDAQLQSYVVKRLEGHSAAVVVMDVHAGDVLAMVSNPAHDPNLFNVGISQAKWREYNESRYKPLINKAIQGSYPPGSTYKMLVALAALEAGVIQPETRVTCTGMMQLGQGRFHCWKRWGHGGVALLQALEESCDVYFYELAKRLGPDRIAAMAKRFGLGERTGIGLPGEREGIVPTRAWKEAVIGRPWLQGETLVVSIGQGYVEATPLQLAVMTARLANGGYAVEPRLLRPDDALEAMSDTEPPPQPGRHEGEPPFPRIDVKPANLALVLLGMWGVVNKRNGTAFASRLVDGVEMSGKTGTSQVRRITMRERERGIRRNEERPWEERHHALFVAYAPHDKPRFAISVIVEHGGGGSSAAAPIAKDIMAETLRLDPLAPRPLPGLAHGRERPRLG